MIVSIAYIVFVILLAVFLILYVVYYSFDLRAFISQAPFVPISKSRIDKILSKARLKSGSTFYELGCGDARVIMHACLKYHVKGIAIDINPLLLLYSYVRSKIYHVPTISFTYSNFYDVSLKNAHTIFVYLLPSALHKIATKFTSECKKGTLIISHRFAIHEYKNRLVQTIDQNGEETFYYKV